MRAAVADVVATVRDQPRVAEVVSPYSASGADNISADRRSALVTFELRGNDDQAQAAIGGVVDRVSAAAERHPGVFVGEFGDASAEAAISDPSTRTSSAPSRCRCR